MEALRAENARLRAINHAQDRLLRREIAQRDAFKSRITETKTTVALDDNYHENDNNRLDKKAQYLKQFRDQSILKNCANQIITCKSCFQTFFTCSTSNVY